jgi:hypothetical protein
VRLSALGDDRKKHASARIAEFPDEASWVSAVKATAASEFHQGLNDSGWVATFDWLISIKGRRALEGGLKSRGVRRNSQGGIDGRDLGYRSATEDEDVERWFRGEFNNSEKEQKHEDSSVPY